tara:strand:+ start:57000 stop:58994 length:1995 start_codon:yes stop_codon:yes gene_type:complete
MVVKGTRISTKRGAAGIADHVFRGSENEEIVCAQGCEAELLDMMADARACGAKYGLRQIILNPAEEMTREQAMEGFSMAAAEFGFRVTDMVIVEHRKPRAEGGFGLHWHGFAPEVDARTEKVLSNKAMFRRHEKLARKMEDAFGHQILSGKHDIAVARALRQESFDLLADKVLKARSDAGGDKRAAYSDAQHQIAKRQGINLPEAKNEIRDLWKRSDNGRAFCAALEGAGYSLERGRKANTWIVQRDGNLIGSVDRLTRTPKVEVADRLAGVQPSGPHVAFGHLRTPDNTRRASVSSGASMSSSAGGGAISDSLEASLVHDLTSGDEHAAEKALRAAAFQERKKQASVAKIGRQHIDYGAVEAARQLTARLFHKGGQNGRARSIHPRRREAPVALHKLQRLHSLPYVSDLDHIRPAGRDDLLRRNARDRPRTGGDRVCDYVHQAGGRADRGSVRSRLTPQQKRIYAIRADIKRLRAVISGAPCPPEALDRDRLMAADIVAIEEQAESFRQARLKAEQRLLRAEAAISPVDRIKHALGLPVAAFGRMEKAKANLSDVCARIQDEETIRTRCLAVAQVADQTIRERRTANAAYAKEVGEPAKRTLKLDYRIEGLLQESDSEFLACRSVKMMQQLMRKRLAAERRQRDEKLRLRKEHDEGWARGCAP